MKQEQATLYAEIERRALTDLLEAAKEFYKNPANMQAFEAWEKSKEGKEYAANYINARPDGREPRKVENLL
ncbi:MAG: hypothetical protein OSJ52_14105 [Lachnospiraceae bacterium]|nr:hypothetical protein [Lachnospiraceae bacterium]